MEINSLQILSQSPVCMCVCGGGQKQNEEGKKFK